MDEYSRLFEKGSFVCFAPSLGGHGDPQIAFALIGVGLLCVPVLYVAGRSP